MIGVGIFEDKVVEIVAFPGAHLLVLGVSEAKCLDCVLQRRHHVDGPKDEADDIDYVNGANDVRSHYRVFELLHLSDVFEESMVVSVHEEK